MKEKRKRIVTKIGDVFCAEVDGEFKAYFQYVANDLTQLNSSVIRVFKTHYPIDHKPVIEDIVKDEVQFYAHTILKFGIEYGAWYKIGKSKDIDETSLNEVVFGCTQDTKPIKENGSFKVLDVNPLENWYIWKINQQHIHVGILAQKYHNIVAPGAVISYNSILTRIKYGYYTNTSEIYEILKRHPLPEVDSYLKTEEAGFSVYYHFIGEFTEKEVVLFNGEKTCLSKENPSVNGMTLRTAAFGETNWLHKNFITRQEFEDVWNT